MFAWGRHQDDLPRVELRLSAPLYKTLEEARHHPEKRDVARYPKVRIEIRAFLHSVNQLDFDEENVFQGRIPDQFIVGLLHANCDNGNVTCKPFSFKSFGLGSITQLCWVKRIAIRP